MLRKIFAVSFIAVFAAGPLGGCQMVDVVEVTRRVQQAGPLVIQRPGVQQQIVQQQVYQGQQPVQMHYGFTPVYDSVASVPASPIVSGDLNSLMRSQRSLVKRDVRKRPSKLPALNPKVPWSHELRFLPGHVTAHLTSPFGWRQLGGRRDFHGGIDVKAVPGTPVLAVVSGKVAHINRSGYRGGVVIEAGNRTYTYWHVKPSRRLSEGQHLSAGEAVGSIASSGARSHLHYAVHAVSRWDLRDDRNAVDPLYMLRTAGLR